MKAERLLDAVTFEERLALADFFENFAWEIFSFQEQAKMGLVKRGIIQQGEKNIRGRMVQKRRKLIASGDGRAFARFSDRLGHKLTFGDLQRARQGSPRELGYVFDNWTRQGTYPGVRSDFANQTVEFRIQESAAVKDSACFCEKEGCVLELKLPQNFKDLIAQVLDSRNQESAC